VRMKQTSKSTQSTVAFCAVDLGCCSTISVGPKLLRLGRLAGILFTIIHLLLELLRFLLVHERQAGKAFFKLEGVEERSVLVVRKSIVDLLIPYHASIGRLSQRASACAHHSLTGRFVLTEMSTSLIQKVFPTVSFDSTAAPCRPAYVHFDLFGYATYSRATATAWILFEAFGTVRLTVSLSTSLRMDGIVY
jgi:hypothetical protein